MDQLIQTGLPMFEWLQENWMAMYALLITFVAATPTKTDDRMLNRVINLINKVLGFTGKQLPEVKPKAKK